MEEVTVEVEYWQGAAEMFSLIIVELKQHLTHHHSDVNVIGQEGRRGSFEVKVNGTVVHSKLQTLAYPDYNDLGSLVEDTKSGKSVDRLCKQQPITSCTIC